MSSPKRACEQLFGSSEKSLFTAENTVHSLINFSRFNPANRPFLASFVLDYLSPKKILARFLYMLGKLPKVVAKNKYFVRALGLVVFSEAISAEEMAERERERMVENYC